MQQKPSSRETFLMRTRQMVIFCCYFEKPFYSLFYPPEITTPIFDAQRLPILRLLKFSFLPLPNYVRHRTRIFRITSGILFKKYDRHKDISSAVLQIPFSH